MEEEGEGVGSGGCGEEGKCVGEWDCDDGMGECTFIGEGLAFSSDIDGLKVEDCGGCG